MEKRTLNQTWTLCLRMWKWIAKVWQTPHYKRYDVSELKTMWLRKNKVGCLRSDCFFCEYGKSCNRCPGKQVNSNFDCCDSKYNYFRKPIVFYKELLRLNRIRKAKK